MARVLALQTATEEEAKALVDKLAKAQVDGFIKLFRSFIEYINKYFKGVVVMVSDGCIPESEIIAKLFQDTPSVITGIYGAITK